jgi:hypothetical protein
MHLQYVWGDQVSHRQSSDGVWSGNGHRCSYINNLKVWLVSYSSLGAQTAMALLSNMPSA